MQNGLDPYYQAKEEEVPVVLHSHAVVQPLTVVVEFLGASVAAATVLGAFLDMAVTPLAEKFVLVFREVLVCYLAEPLVPDNDVAWVCHGGDHSKTQHHYVKNHEYDYKKGNYVGPAVDINDFLE